MTVALLFVCVIAGCARGDTGQAKRVVDGYMQNIQQGTFDEAKQYCSDAFNKDSALASTQKTMDAIAKESNYTKAEKAAFENYVLSVVGAQYYAYSFEDVQQNEQECIVTLKVEGVSDDTLSTIDIQTMEEDLKQEIFNTQSEEYIVTYFQTLSQRIDALPKTETRVYIVLDKIDEEWKITEMVNE